MLSTIKAFLAPYKLYIFMVLAGLLAGAWTVDRTAQYNRGKTACESEQLRRAAEDTRQAIEAADRARKELEQLKAKSNQTMVKINEAAKSNPCRFNDDELFIINDAISSGPSGSKRTVSAPGANKK